MKSPLLRVAALAMAALALAACTAVAPATVIRDPNVDPDAASPALLNPGNFPTTPREALGAAGEKGNVEEGRRLGDFTIMPFEVDPEMTETVGVQVGPIKNVAAITKAVTEPINLGAEGHNFIVGFTVSGQRPGEPTDAYLKNAVLLFATPEDATAAAADMSARASEVEAPFSDEPQSRNEMAIPRYPAARGFVNETFAPRMYVTAISAHGSFVLTQNAGSATSAEAAAEIAAATLDLQIPLLDTFVPTPPDQLAALPLDPDGLLARMLPAESPTVHDGYFGPHGALTYQTNRPTSEKLFQETGMTTWVSSGDTHLYVLTDNAAAQRLVDSFATEVQAQGFTEAAGVPGLPGAQCLLSPKPESGEQDYYCLATVDNLAFEITAERQDVVHQMVSAQYLMLTAK